MLIAALALAMQVPAAAPATCTTIAPPPVELTGWKDRVALNSGSTPNDAAPLIVGKAVAAHLRPSRDIRYALAPAKSGQADSYGGLFGFEVKTAGRYRIALGAAAWVDVLANGVAAKSSGHGHGQPCTGIRKLVDFDLPAGRYVLQISGAGAAEMQMMIASVAL